MALCPGELEGSRPQLPDGWTFNKSVRLLEADTRQKSARCRGGTGRFAESSGGGGDGLPNDRGSALKAAPHISLSGLDLFLD